MSLDGAGTGSAAAETAKSEIAAHTANMAIAASNLPAVRDLGFTDVVGRIVELGMMPPLWFVKDRPQTPKFLPVEFRLLGQVPSTRVPASIRGFIVGR